MKFSKKLMAWLMTASMAAALVPTTALAEEPTVQTESATGAETGGAADETASDLTQESVDSADAENAVQETENQERKTEDVKSPDPAPQAKTAAAPAADAATADENALPESDHPYADNEDQTWEYEEEGAANGVVITFDEQTETESGYDYIYILDEKGEEVGKYSGKELAGAHIAVPTAKFTIRLTSDSSGQQQQNNAKWGFKVTAVEEIEKGDLAQAGTASIAEIPSWMLDGEHPAEPLPVVTYMGKELTKDKDYTVSWSDNDKAGTGTVTVTGTGAYKGTLTAEFLIASEDDLLEPAKVNPNGASASIRQTGETGSASITMAGVTNDWANNITEITLTPVDEDGTVVDTEGAEYPHAPKEVTLTKEDITVSGNSIRFSRTADDPVVYVMEGHEPLTVKTMWGSEMTYPQSQIYNVTIESTNYEDTTGQMTYYTGTSPDFSIIIEDEDGNQEVAASWTSDEIEEMSTFANGSSQCGMTGFRSFSGMGVTLTDMLKEAGVTVTEDDYFLLDTSDHYGNTFTYEQLFGTTRYFLEGIYDEGFAEKYQELVAEDDGAGEVKELRRYLAEQCLEDHSVVEPRINVQYVESMISGDSLDEAVLPTQENTEYNDLVSYENQFRFFYGISLTQDECQVTFDSQGGSEVAPQTVLSHEMTSTENTTMWSSYWANALVIYEGQADEYKQEEGITDEPSTAADALTVPEAPTKEGYVFGGWYTDEDCTSRFNFNSNDGTVEEDTTLYARWIPENEAPVTVTDYDITNAPHNDADGELNQTIIVTIDFAEPITMDAEALAQELDIRIAGGSVADTPRTVTYAVNPENPNQLVITMVSTDWAAIYNGILTIDGAEISGLKPADGSGREVLVNHLEGRIPIGIVVNNDILTEGTDSAAASTYVNVAHKANMRGMYFFELVSIVDGQETVIGSSVSHAHNFYTSIDEAAIASAMASAIDGYDGYSTTYTDGNTWFIVTADSPKAGETIAVRMQEYKAGIDYAEHDHVAVTDPAVPATDTATGLTEGSHCAICGEVLKAQEETPVLNTQDPGQGNGQNQTQTGGQNNDQNQVQTGSQNKTVSAKTADTNPLYIWVFAALAGCAAAVTAAKKRTSRK